VSDPLIHRLSAYDVLDHTAIRGRQDQSHTSRATAAAE